MFKKFWNLIKEDVKNVDEIGENTYTEVDGKDVKVTEMLNYVKESKEKEKQNAEKEKMKEDKDFMNDDKMVKIGDEKVSLKDLVNIYKGAKKNEMDEDEKKKKEEKNRLEIEEKNRLEIEEKNTMDEKEKMKNKHKMNELKNAKSFDVIKNAGGEPEDRTIKNKFISIDDRVAEGKLRYGSPVAK